MNGLFTPDEEEDDDGEMTKKPESLPYMCMRKDSGSL
jgi:hypothetical protein